ncbi:MAG: Spy/CpxP family protein refolding chaperone, partial [Ignavibacteria bacterium]
MDTSLNEKKEPNKPASKLSGLLKLKFIIPAIIAAILLTTTFSIVMAKKKFADGPNGFMLGMLINKLDLNETQKAQAEKIRDEIHARMQTNMNDNQTIREDLASEFAKDNLDKSDLMALDQKRQQEMNDDKEFMMEKMIEFHNILTPSQRQKAADLMKDTKGNFQRGMGNGPNGPNGKNGPNCQNCQNCPNGKNGP